MFTETYLETFMVNMYENILMEIIRTLEPMMKPFFENSY